MKTLNVTRLDLLPKVAKDVIDYGLTKTFLYNYHDIDSPLWLGDTLDGCENYLS